MYMIAILVFALFVSGVPNYLMNVYANNADEWDSKAEGDLVIASSVANQGRQGEGTAAQGVLNILAGIGMMIIYYACRRDLDKYVHKLDLSVDSPSDYTLMVSGMKKTYDLEKVKSFIENYGRKDGTQVVIERTTMVYDIEKQVKLSHEYMKILAKLEVIRNYEEKSKEIPDDDKIRVLRNFSTQWEILKNLNWLCGCFLKDDEWDKQKLEDMKDKKKKSIEKYYEDRKKDHGEDLILGMLFITCKKQTDVRAIDTRWGGDLDFMGNRCRIKCFDNTGDDSNKPDFEIAKIAPEPSDIRWENLGVEFSVRVCLFFAFWIGFFILLWGISFPFLIYVKQAQQEQYKEWKEDQSLDKAGVYLYYVLIVAFIGMVNVSIKYLVKYMTLYELSHTWTESNINKTIKTIYFQWLHTSWLLLVVYGNQKNEVDKTWFQPDGLVADIFWILVIGTSGNILWHAIGLSFSLSGHQCKRYKRWRAKKNPEKVWIQKELNDIFEGPEFDLCNRYSIAIKLFQISVMYAPILPLSLLIAPVGLIIEFLLTKYLLLFRCKRPNQNSADLSRYTMQCIPNGIWCHAIINLIVQIGIGHVAVIVLSAIWYFIVQWLVWMPITILQRVFKGKLSEEKIEQLFGHAPDFKKQATRFVEDYDRKNPATAQEGNAYFKQLLEVDSQSPDDDISLPAIDLLQRISENEEKIKAIQVASAVAGETTNDFGAIFRYAQETRANLLYSGDSSSLTEMEAAAHRFRTNLNLGLLIAQQDRAVQPHQFHHRDSLTRYQLGRWLASSTLAGQTNQRVGDPTSVRQMPLPESSEKPPPIHEEEQHPGEEEQHPGEEESTSYVPIDSSNPVLAAFGYITSLQLAQSSNPPQRD